MPSANSMGLWQGEKDKFIFACQHCGERTDIGKENFPRSLCPNCSGKENRIEMHEENKRVFGANWECKVCVALIGKTP